MSDDRLVAADAAPGEAYDRALRPHHRNGGTAMDDGTLERRAMGAEQLVAAKITEFGAHLTAGDRAAAERARTEALAALEVHLDLTDQLISQTFA